MSQSPDRIGSYARRYLILVHRYLGIALGLLLVVWFASGIVMMYVGGMPSLGPELRLARLPALDLARVKLTPGEAARARAAGDGAAPILLSVQGRPAYRFDNGSHGSVFADDGALLGEIDIAAAREIASRFAGLLPDQLRFERTLTRPDQWTLGQQAQMPLHEFRRDDPEGIRLYVSATLGEVVQLTTARTRALAWAGAIPHWLYFAALRNNQSLWSRTVVWLAGAACVLGLLGLVLAFTQFRRTHPLRLALAIPYRGWLRWHYVGGSLFGLFALTWAFSGMLSMQPFAWNNVTGLDVGAEVFSGGPTDLARFGAFDAAGLQRIAGSGVIKEIGFRRIQDEHYYDLHVGVQRSLLVNAATLAPLSTPFSTNSIIGRLTAAVIDYPIVEQRLLDEYDSYYYSRDRQRALPVLRVKFGDPARTWVYVDPRTSTLVAEVHRYRRLERWLYNGLHSLDFRFWYDKRPWWDLGVITLLLGGLVTSVLGTYLGIKRLLS